MRRRKPEHYAVIRIRRDTKDRLRELEKEARRRAYYGDRWHEVTDDAVLRMLLDAYAKKPKKKARKKAK